MVDRDARDRMALLLRRLVTGRITNDEFEDEIPRSPADPAVTAIYRHGAWGLYSDLHQHRLVGRLRLPREERREVARFILFLKSDLEYEWTSPGLLQGLLWTVAGLLTLGWTHRLYRRRLGRQGEVRVWPFLRQEDFERAVRSPCYLAGPARV